MAIVDELVTLLTLKNSAGNARESKKLEDSLGEITKKAALVGAALVGAAAATGLWIKSVSESVDSSGKFAASIGETFQDLQEFEFAVKRAGGEVGGLRSDLEKLAGTSGRKATAILSDLAAEFDGLSAQGAQQLGQKLGLTSDTILLLQQGQSGIRALRNEAQSLGVIIPEESTKLAAKFQGQLINITSVIKSLSLQAGVGLLPVLTEVVQSMTQFVAQNRALIQGGLTTFIRGVTRGFGNFFESIEKVYNAVKDILPSFGDLGDEIDGVKVIAFLVVGALAVLTGYIVLLTGKAALAAVPLIALGAAIDDVYTYFKGGDSVTGRFLDIFAKKMPNAFALAKQGVNSLKTTLEDLFEYFSRVKDVFVKIGEFSIGNIGRTFGIIDESLPAAAAVSSSVPVLGSTVNHNQQGGNVYNNINVSGVLDPRQAATEVIRRAGFGSAQKLAAPGTTAAVIN